MNDEIWSVKWNRRNGVGIVWNYYALCESQDFSVESEVEKRSF